MLMKSIPGAKAAQRMLMKLTPGVNFTNMFTCSFCTCQSQKRKKTDDLTVFFMLLGSAHVKAAQRMSMKSTPGRPASSRRCCPGGYSSNGPSCSTDFGHSQALALEK